jgi:diketogulonate reductase-like aldo/keto reductase
VQITDTLPLSHGGPIPRRGRGVFRSGAGAGTRDAVLAALRAGYRHVDTARIYRNEREVGEALRASGVPRAEVFVTTKLWNDDQGYDSTLRALESSLKDLGLDHVDLYLMHWPVPGKRRDSWRAMEQLHREGRCRAIGVSNFMPRHLDDLIEVAEVRPAVNQIELHPFLQQRDAVARSSELGIVVEAYSPFAKGRRLEDPRLSDIARSAGRSPAQVLVRWSLQKGYVVLPKSATPERIAANANVFDFALTAEAMAKLDALEEGFRSAWDPSVVP